MGAFVILSVLAVTFYLVLLLALYVDGLKGRSHRVNLYHYLEVGQGSVPCSANASQVSTETQHDLPPSDGARWIPVAKVYWQDKEANRDANPDKVVAIAARTHPVGSSHSR